MIVRIGRGLNSIVSVQLHCGVLKVRATPRLVLRLPPPRAASSLGRRHARPVARGGRGGTMIARLWKGRRNNVSIQAYVYASPGPWPRACQFAERVVTVKRYMSVVARHGHAVDRNER